MGKIRCLKCTVNKNITSILLAGGLFVAGGCTTQNGQSATQWEYQDATNSVEASQMAEKGWMVSGFSKYTDATGQPQTTYMMKRPRQ